MSRHFILVPFGSSGDVNPFLWMAKILRSRGHEVSVIVTPPFEEAALKTGATIHTVGEPGIFEAAVANPDLWHPRKGSRLVMRYAGEAIDEYYQMIRVVAESSALPPVLIHGSLAFGARVAREKLGITLVSVHLQPSVFLSVHDMPVPMAGMEWITRMPTWLKRLLLRLPNPIDFSIGPYVTRICRREGLKKPKRVWPTWFNSPDLVLGLFPEWFATPQPDWPANTRLIGFPLYDLSDQHEIPAELDRFLAQGSPPVLVTPGSANAHGRELFDAAIEACTRLNQRILVVTPYRDQLPDALPVNLFHVDRIPFSLVLHRVSAFVHHGGIGTLAQGLAAGKPQLLTPMAYDQPDNANRLVRMGAGGMLYPKKCTPANIAEELNRLINSHTIAANCARIRKRAAADSSGDKLLSALKNLPAAF